MLDLVEDNVAVVHALGEESAVVVGHDWGADHRRQLRPAPAGGLPRGRAAERPLRPARRPAPSDVFARMGGDEEFYVSYFQEPGRAEAEIEPDVRGWLAGFYAALSADTMPAPGAPDPHFVSPRRHAARPLPRRPAARPGSARTTSTSTRGSSSAPA